MVKSRISYILGLSGLLIGSTFVTLQAMRAPEVRVVPYTFNQQGQIIFLLKKTPRGFAPLIVKRVEGKERSWGNTLLSGVALDYAPIITSSPTDPAQESTIFVGTRTGDFYFFVPVQWKPIHDFKIQQGRPPAEVFVWVEGDKAATSLNVETTRLAKPFTANIIQSFHEMLKGRWVPLIKPDILAKQAPPPRPAPAAPPVDPIVGIPAEVQTALRLPANVSPYELLSVASVEKPITSGSSKSEVSASYKRASLVWHPDTAMRRGIPKETADEVFKAVANARDAIFAQQDW